LHSALAESRGKGHGIVVKTSKGKGGKEEKGRKGVRGRKGQAIRDGTVCSCGAICVAYSRSRPLAVERRLLPTGNPLDLPWQKGAEAVRITPLGTCIRMGSVQRWTGVSVYISVPCWWSSLFVSFVICFQILVARMERMNEEGRNMGLWICMSRAHI
jgi:hypothetical protein